MICFPNAKINIGLNIIRKREDGYHDIESVMYPLKGIMYDALEVVRSSEFGVRSSGLQIQGEEKNNLCVKAYELLAGRLTTDDRQKGHSIRHPSSVIRHLPPVNIYLHKAIPMGAGLGGGSADGACMIRLLNDEFELGLAWGELHHYAKQLGSDCSFFITNRPAFAEGKGDELESVNLDLSGYHIAVVYPDIHINTATAYSEFDKAEGKRQSERTPSEKAVREDSFGEGGLENLIQLPIEKWKGNIINDFEDVIFPKHPEIKKIKETLYSLGAIYSSMSGSGSSVYGIFKKEVWESSEGVDTHIPSGKVKKKFAGCQVWEGRI